MISLIRLFAFRIVRVLAVCLGSMLLVSALGLKLDISSNVLVAMTVSFVPIVYLLLSQLNVPSNLSWVRSLPLSRKQMLLLHFGTNLLLLSGVLVATFVLVSAQTIMGQGWAKYLEALAKFISSFQAGDGVWSIDEVHGFWLLALFGIAALFTLSAPGFMKGTMTTRAGRRTAALFIIGVSAFLGVMYLLRYYLDVSIVAFVLLLFGTITVSWYLTEISLGMPRGERRRLMAVSAAFGLVATSHLVWFARGQLQAKSIDKVAEAVVFLGPYSGQLDASRVSALLQRDIKASDVHKLREVLLRYHIHREHLAAADREWVDFEQVVGSKSKWGALENSLWLFDPKTISESQLRFVLRKADHLSDYPGNVPSRLRHVAVSADTLISMLESDSEAEVSFALRRARYSDEPSLVPVIVGRARRYTPSNQAEAVHTLSILLGKRIGLVEFGNLVKDRVPASVPAFDCDKTPFSKTSEIKEAHLGWINRCLRRRARQNDAIESPSFERAWMDFAWVRRDLQQIKTALKLKE